MHGAHERVPGAGGVDGRRGEEGRARAFTDHYATVTNYNDATVMRLLVQRAAFLPPRHWDR